MARNYARQTVSSGRALSVRALSDTSVRPPGYPTSTEPGRRRRGGRAEEVRRRRCRLSVECHLKQSNRIYISTRPNVVVVNGRFGGGGGDGILAASSSSEVNQRSMHAYILNCKTRFG